MGIPKNIFWGLVVRPGKRYETVVEEPFRITKACLEPSTAAEKVSSLYLESDNSREFIIASLSTEIFNVSLDLAFNLGEKICFKVEGLGSVHLSGNLLRPDEADIEMMDQSDSSMDDDEGSIDDSESSSDESTCEPETQKKGNDDVKHTNTNKPEDTPKVKLKVPALKSKQQQPKQAETKTSNDGVVVEDLIVGVGQVARKGNGVGLYYKGWLQNNSKVFDSCLSGKPFKFKLGSGQVIAGWDKGVVGMKVGGKRRLTIPARMGYGSSGAPPRIPPNATLVFDVECKFVKVYGGNNVL